MSVIQLFILFGLVQALFLSVVLLSKSGKKQPLLFLGLFLFIEAIGLAEQMLYLRHSAEGFTFLVGLSYPLSFLRPVLIFLFARSYFQKGVELSIKHSLHLIPTVLCLILFLPLILANTGVKENQVSTISTSIWSDSLQGIVFFCLMNLIYGTYYFLTLRVLKTALNTTTSNQSHQVRWVINLIRFLIYFYVFKLLLFVLSGFHLVSGEYFSITVMLISSFTVQVIAWLLFSPSKWPEFSHKKPVTELELQGLLTTLEQEKAYLDDELTIKRLASRCGLSQERLSELFKLHYKESFKETINRLRVREAQELIKSELNGKPLNLLAIAMDSGFNNKVTFHRVFKKATGVAPSVYVKQLRSAG